MSFYAYLHCKPDGTPFYVGKGDEKRVSIKKREHNLQHTKILNEHGLENILVGKMECSTEDFAFELERGLIKRLRKMNVSIVNLTDGGDGLSGFSRSPETRAKMSAAQIGNKKSLGVKRSPETRAKMAAGKIGNKWNLGRKYSEETRRKKSKSLGGFPVECEKEGVFLTFFSISEAARILGLDAGNISNSLKKSEAGKKSRVKGWSFKRIRNVS
jgi:group I intron endonuclease